MNYPEFFQRATGHPPYDYQKRLACGVNGDFGSGESRPQIGTFPDSRLISIPTGLGKTAAVVLAWLWNRVAQPDPSARTKWPRRLRLLEHYGPFRLAFFEALFRAADIRASISASQRP